MEILELSNDLFISDARAIPTWRLNDWNENGMVDVGVKLRIEAVSWP
jgi:hypothetical protein